MQITIAESEIKVAILDYVAKQGLTITANAEVDLKAGRGDNGMSATIDIGDILAADPIVQAVPTPAKKTSVKETVDSIEEEKPAEKDEKVKEPADNKPLFG